MFPGYLLPAGDVEDLLTGLATMPEATEPLAEAKARELFDQHSGGVYRFFIRRGFEPEEARDLTQETFLRAFRAIDSLRDPAGARPWLFSIAFNLLRNVLRQRAASKRGRAEESREIRKEDEETVEAEAPHELDRLLDRERRDRLATAVRELPPRMRQCVLLLLDQGLKYGEIAAVMQVSTDTVKSLLAQARSRLRERLGQELGDASSD